MKSRIKPTWPTRLGAIFVMLIIAIGGLGIVFSNNLFYLVVAMMLGFITVSGLIAEHTLNGLSARLSTAGEVFARRPTSLILSLANGKARFPSFGLAIRQCEDGAWGPDRLRLMHLAAGGVVTLTWATEWSRRGWQAIEGVWVATRFPFCLWEKATWVPCRTRVLVYPAPEAAPEVALDHASAAGVEARAVRGAGLTVVTLRDYVPGDSLRHIHWKRSARTGVMQTKEMEQETERAVTVVVDCAAGPAFERALSLATGLLLELDGLALPWALATHAGTTRVTTGKTHLREALAHLALLEPAPGTWTPRPGELDREASRVVVVHAAGAAPAWLDARVDEAVPVT